MPNAKVLESKKEIVSKFTEKLKNSKAGIFVDYRGLTVEEDTILRKKLRESSVEYSVVKNTIMRFAIKNAEIENFEDGALEGPTALAITNDDVLGISKILVDFSKENKCFNIKSGFMDGKGLELDDINKYASIPSKEILISKILGSLNAPISKLVRTLDAVAKKDTEDTKDIKDVENIEE